MKVSYPTQFLHYQNPSLQKKSYSTALQDPDVASIKKRIHPISQHQKDKLIQDLTIKVAKLRQKYSEQINQYKSFIYDLLKKNNSLQQKIDYLQSQEIFDSQFKLVLKQKISLIGTVLQNGKLYETQIQNSSFGAVSQKFDQILNKLIQDNKLLRATIIPKYKTQISQLKEKIFSLYGQLSKAATIAIKNPGRFDYDEKKFRSNMKIKPQEQKENTNDIISKDRYKIEHYNKICEIFGINTNDEHIQEELLEKINSLKNDRKMLVNEIKKTDEKLKISKVKNIELKNEILSLKKQSVKSKQINLKLSQLLNSYTENILKENITKLNDAFKNE